MPDIGTGWLAPLDQVMGMRLRSYAGLKCDCPMKTRAASGESVRFGAPISFDLATVIVAGMNKPTMTVPD
ncbi:MAG: hypothetical protein PGN23_13445 [Sphingomonas adhaesiva]|uniref:hypothetical protein n=1 Tax=Sphingomonas adhaesiva TaxID=28212 RepID=UPI002FF9D1EE